MQITATFKIVYGWMCAGLALSGVVAWSTVESAKGLFDILMA